MSELFITHHEPVDTPVKRIDYTDLAGDRAAIYMSDHGGALWFKVYDDNNNPTGSVLVADKDIKPLIKALNSLVENA